MRMLQSGKCCVFDDKVKCSKDIPNFDTLLSCLRNFVQTIHLNIVTCKEILVYKYCANDKQIPSFVGTMKVHQNTSNKEKHDLQLMSNTNYFAERKYSGKLNYSTIDLFSLKARLSSGNIKKKSQKICKETAKPFNFELEPSQTATNLKNQETFV